MFKIRTEIVEKEVVSVPAGKFECYKPQLILDTGFLNLLTKHFLPKTYMWFAVEEPHIWVKYKGLESGLGSPYVVMELVEFNR